MRKNMCEVFIHLVWATWDRMPLITPAARPHLYRCLHAEATRHGADVLAAGGMDDHVHLLVRLPATISISDLAKAFKGSSSHLMNHGIERPVGFKWQGSYGAFSVSKRLLPRVQDYIVRQEEHHRLGTVYPDFEPS